MATEKERPMPEGEKPKPPSAPPLALVNVGHGCDADAGIIQPPDAVGPRCDRCKYFHADRHQDFRYKDAAQYSEDGFCRRRDPTFNSDHLDFPAIRHARQMWCGEFEPKVQP